MSERLPNIDPTELLDKKTLRAVILDCIEWGKVRIGWHQGQDRMEERNITGGQILGALRSGTLSDDQCAAGVWRYLARKNDVEICFCFEVDEDGNVLVVVTLMRKD